MQNMIDKLRAMMESFRRFSVGIWLRAIIFSLCLLIVGAYMILINSAVIGGYRLSSMEKELMQRQAEMTRLNMAIVRLGSHEQVQREVQDMDMVKADNVFYIENSSSLVYNDADR